MDKFTVKLFVFSIWIFPSFPRMIDGSFRKGFSRKAHMERDGERDDRDSLIYLNVINNGVDDIQLHSIIG